MRKLLTQSHYVDRDVLHYSYQYSISNIYNYEVQLR